MHERYNHAIAGVRALQAEDEFHILAELAAVLAWAGAEIAGACRMAKDVFAAGDGNRAAAVALNAGPRTRCALGPDARRARRAVYLLYGASRKRPDSKHMALKDHDGAGSASSLRHANAPLTKALAPPPSRACRRVLIARS
jgi:hypothetical protein